jgi:hypothetical protein
MIFNSKKLAIHIEFAAEEFLNANLKKCEISNFAKCTLLEWNGISHKSFRDLFQQISIRRKLFICVARLTSRRQRIEPPRSPYTGQAMWIPSYNSPGVFLLPCGDGPGVDLACAAHRVQL